MANTKGLTVNGRPVTDDEYKAYWNAVFQRDPEMQRIFQQVSGSGNGQRISQARQTVQQLEPQMQQIRQLAQTGQRPTPEQLQIANAYNEAQFVATRGGAEAGKEQAFDRRARELGWETPGDGWSLDFDESGPRVEREGYLQRNKQWIIPASIGAIGAAGGLGAFGGGASSLSSTATPSLGSAVGATGSVPASLTTGGVTLGAAPAVAGTAPALGTVGGTTGMTAGSTTAATAGGGAGSALTTGPVISSKDFWGKLALGIGGDLFNGYIANRSANKAADELIESGDKQIAAYDKALGPYMDPAPLNALKFLSGLPAGGGQAPSATPMATPFDTNRLDNATTGRTAPAGAQFSPGMAVPRQGTLSSLVPQAQRQQAQQQTASSFVRMVSPDGEEGDVHPSQVQSAIQAGARPLQAAMGRG